MAKSPEAFRTISEVADWLDTPAHVLRFWESRFTQVKPVKRAGGRRYYRPSDMALLGGIKKLLHEDGMTIRGAQKLLREQGVRYVAAMSAAIEGYDMPVTEVDEAPMAENVAPSPESGSATVVQLSPKPSASAPRAEDDMPAPVTDYAYEVDESAVREPSLDYSDDHAPAQPGLPFDEIEPTSPPLAPSDEREEDVPADEHLYVAPETPFEDVNADNDAPDEAPPDVSDGPATDVAFDTDDHADVPPAADEDAAMAAMAQEIVAPEIVFDIPDDPEDDDAAFSATGLWGKLSRDRLREADPATLQAAYARLSDLRARMSQKGA